MTAAGHIVCEARGWIGTPYRHGQSLRGAGCDCLGLIRGVARALGVNAPARLPPYPPGWAFRGQGEILAEGLAAHLVPLEAGRPLAPGQVLLFRMRAGAPAGHLGILTRAGTRPAMVHAYDRHGVVESPLAAPWARRITARFGFS